MVFYDSSSFLGGMLEQFTISISGSLALTLLAVFIFLIGLFIMFRVPINIIIILLLPITLSFIAYEASGFLAVGGVVLMFAGVLLARSWLIR